MELVIDNELFFGQRHLYDDAFKSVNATGNWLKRKFRDIATIAALYLQDIPGNQKKDPGICRPPHNYFLRYLKIMKKIIYY